ncbi:hypothetical protein PG997_007259 [Apiospora hydei]|uniref:Caspase domain-containing protein n=1 Tax=Apiospora hydei TaxID=1337664 RepID=A0ABR1W7H7_9PEZI
MEAPQNILENTNPRDPTSTGPKFLNYDDLGNRIKSAQRRYPLEFLEEYYDAVHVFMAGWDVDREEGWLEEQRRQMSRLEAVFRDGYGYVTHRHTMKIDDGRAGATLSRAFKELTDGLDGKKTLIIFFYAGRRTLFEEFPPGVHGTPDLLIYCGDKNGNLGAPVSLGHFRENCVANLEHDVLILLDCCYGTTAEVGPGSKELIAASGKDRTAVQGKRGFTAKIAALLETARRDGRDYTTSLLFTDLVRMNFLKDPDAEQAEASSPVTLMSEITLHASMNKGRLPIVLAPVGRRLGPGESRQLVNQNLLWRKDISVILEVQFERGGRDGQVRVDTSTDRQSRWGSYPHGRLPPLPRPVPGAYH